ncbi:MAG TPA: TetR/AcrR family transcriptional regulator [Frankiaceae bacterium]|jgi:AcrR family transcriptional regulator|nr:TetR/AcrR family transcriptional regulator [Frankiaceae bacterium]
MAVRKGPRDFFVAAFEILESDGFPALTAAGLCDRMSVTRGSFYHHFGSFDAFVESLMRYWEERYTADPFALVETLETDEARRAEQILLAQALPHGAEAAIRVWSTVNPQVASAQRHVDQRRLQTTVNLLRRQGLSQTDAQTYADLAVSSLAGLQLMRRPLDGDVLRRVLSEIHSQVEGRRAMPSDLRRARAHRGGST